MRVILLGSNGQLGKDLEIGLKNTHSLLSLSREECCITSMSNMSLIFNKFKPDVVINCAAYTHVDDAEDNKDLCFLVNHIGVKNLAKLSVELDFMLIHFSTDYVFSAKENSPIEEDDPKGPLNVYGESKLYGENEILQNCSKYLIFRISWVYGIHGKNFPKTILNLAKKEKNLKIVNDQIGTPTPTTLVLDALSKILNDLHKYNMEEVSGIYHLSPSGACSWYDVANEILKFIKDKKGYKLSSITPINSFEFSSKAKRPNFSQLSNKKINKTFNIKPLRWDIYLKRFLIQFYDGR